MKNNYLCIFIVLLVGIITLLVTTLTGRKHNYEYLDSYVIIKNGRFGLIDSVGNEIINPRFLYVEPIKNDGVALAVIDTIITTIPCAQKPYERNQLILNIKYGYVCKSDKFIFSKPSFAKIQIDTFDEVDNAYFKFCKNFSYYGGLALAQDTTTMRYGYIDLDGDTIITAKFLNACIFNQGRAAVKVENHKKQERWGLINSQGEPVCDFVYTHLETPINGRSFAGFTFTQNDKYNPIQGTMRKDQNGNIIVEKSDINVEKNSDESTRISFKLFLVDENGRIVNENLNYLMYDFKKFTQDGIAVASPTKFGELLGCGYKFIDINGNDITSMDIRELTTEQESMLYGSKHYLNTLLPADVEFKNVTKFSQGYAAVDLGKGWIFVDTKLIPRGNNDYPFFENILPFSYGLAGVKLNGKYGYINRNFNFVIPCKYDSCAIAGKNLCLVYSGKKSQNGYSILSYINQANEVVWQNIEFDDVIPFNKKTRVSGMWNEKIEYNYISKDNIIVWIKILIIAIAIIILIFVISKSRKNNSLNDDREIENKLDEVLFKE